MVNDSTRKKNYTNFVTLFCQFNITSSTKLPFYPVNAGKVMIKVHLTSHITMIINDITITDTICQNRDI